MSFVMAALYDRFMRGMEEACGAAWRDELLAGVSGDVLEIGAGTGRNLDHYRSVDRLILAEPDRHMRAKLAHAVARASSGLRVEVRSDSADRLGLPNASVDVVVSTLVLCSVGDLQATLADIRRVLRPGGRLVFLEHVASDDAARLAWQRRLEWPWKLVAGGCHLTRDTASAMEAAGFGFDRIVRESARKAMPIVRSTIRGTARPTAG